MDISYKTEITITNNTAIIVLLLPAEAPNNKLNELLQSPNTELFNEFLSHLWGYRGSEHNYRYSEKEVVGENREDLEENIKCELKQIKEILQRVVHKNTKNNIIIETHTIEY